jgi:hypothetical protein
MITKKNLFQFSSQPLAIFINVFHLATKGAGKICEMSWFSGRLLSGGYFMLGISCVGPFENSTVLFILSL